MINNPSDSKPSVSPHASQAHIPLLETGSRTVDMKTNSKKDGFKELQTVPTPFRIWTFCYLLLLCTVYKFLRCDKTMNKKENTIQVFSLKFFVVPKHRGSWTSTRSWMWARDARGLRHLDWSLRILFIDSHGCFWLQVGLAKRTISYYNATQPIPHAGSNFNKSQTRRFKLQQKRREKCIYIRKSETLGH